MPRERGTSSISLSTFAGLLSATTVRWRSAVGALRGMRALRGAADPDADPGDSEVGVETDKAWRAGLSAAALVVLLLAGTWWLTRGRSAVAAADSLAALAPRRVAGKAGASRTGGRQSPPAPRGESAGAALPEAYKILLTRSVFARSGRAGAAEHGDPPSPRHAGFLLKGISQEDQHFTAFVADRSGDRVVEIHVGDALPAGRVREITLEDVAIESEGRVVRVQVGQVFEAGVSAESQASTR